MRAPFRAFGFAVGTLGERLVFGYVDWFVFRDIELDTWIWSTRPTVNIVTTIGIFIYVHQLQCYCCWLDIYGLGHLIRRQYIKSWRFHVGVA